MFKTGFERFVARRFLAKEGSSFSRSLVRIAMGSIALGVVVMVMSVCILRGFQKEIESKVIGFGSHIIVKSYEVGQQFEEIPISTDRPEVERIQSLPEVSHIQFFATKGGMIKTQDQIHGIIFKGVDSGYDSSFFAQNIVEGRLFGFTDSAASNEVIISQTIAKKLNLAIGDKVRTYFWQGENYRARAFTVTGIYSTDLADFDEHYIVGDLRQVQRINGWDSSQVAGYEVLIKDFNNLDNVSNEVLQQLSYDLTLTTIVAQNPALFSWLDLLNSNIILILSIMALVCAVSIISALLIMIFEKTSMIGTLKSMGANNASIRKIFLLKSSEIILKGILIGDLIAFILCELQQRLQIIKLDPESYSMSFVPIELSGWLFLGVSVGTFIVCLAALLIPIRQTTHIKPAITIKSE